jgi:hypothetical protein
MSEENNGSTGLEEGVKIVDMIFVSNDETMESCLRQSQGTSQSRIIGRLMDFWVSAFVLQWFKAKSSD